MRSFLFATLFTCLAGCGADLSTHVNALSGQTCEPDSSYMPRAHTSNGNGGGDQCQGTGPGDNCDDLHSGKIDCIGDGNSGQGDDKKHNCMFPQPGCDENGCCDDDIVEPDPNPQPDPEPQPPQPEPSPNPL